MRRLLRRLFAKRYAKGGGISSPIFMATIAAKQYKLEGAEGVLVNDGRLIYWKEIG